MRELALARGVYPVVALVTWEVMEKKGRKEVVVKEKEKEKEKGVSQVEPQKEKGKPFIPPGSKRFAFGRRGQGQGSTTSSSTSARSTTRGSTASQSEIQEVQAACLGNQGGAGRCEHGGGDRDDLDVH